MKVNVYQQATVSHYVGEMEVPDDAAPEEIPEMIDNFAFDHLRAMGNLCHSCSGTVGDLGDAETYAEDEAGEVLLRPYYQQEAADLRARVEAAEARERTLREERTELLSIIVDAWEQWSYTTKDGMRWAGGLSTLEEIQGTLGPLGLLDDQGNVIPEAARAALAQAAAQEGTGEG